MQNDRVKIRFEGRHMLKRLLSIVLLAITPIARTPREPSW